MDVNEIKDCNLITNFHKLSINVQKMFYISSIYSKLYNIGNIKLSGMILNRYKKVLFNIGIIGRKEIGNLSNVNVSRSILSEEKGILKKHVISSIINKYNVFPNEIVYFDDNKDIITSVQTLGIRTILTPNFLKPIQLQNLIEKEGNKISIVLTDLSMTLLTRDIRKREWKRNRVMKMIKTFFGGRERLNNLIQSFRELEQQGVRIGIITFQASEFTEIVLKDVGMIN